MAEAPVHPSEAIRKSIRALVACGLKQIEIATYLQISTKTMHEHYKDALADGNAHTYGMVGSKIIDACERDEPWALQLVAKRRMGWSERHQLEEMPPAPLPESSVSDIDRILSNATPEELDLIDALIARTTAVEPGPDTPAD